MYDDATLLGSVKSPLKIYGNIILMITLNCLRTLVFSIIERLDILIPVTFPMSHAEVMYGSDSIHNILVCTV